MIPNGWMKLKSGLQIDKGILALVPKIKWSFVIFVLAPTFATGFFLLFIAADRYVSEFRFTVRQQMPLRGDGPISSPLSGGNPLMALIVDSEVVVQYLKSRQVIDDISPHLDLDRMYARSDIDPWFRLKAGATIEDRLIHWRRIVDANFDLTNGIVTVQVRAFAPSDAAELAAAVLNSSEKLVNDLSRRAAEDALSYAEKTVGEAASRLAGVQGRMAAFRNANAVLFPQIQANTAGGVEGRLRDTLAEARSYYNALSTEGVSASAPQMLTLQARIKAIEGELQDALGRISANNGTTATTTTMASTMAGYSALEAEERFSLGLYEKALGNLEAARATALQQLVYLNAFVRPAKPDRSTEPMRLQLLLEAFFVSLIVWGLGQLITRAIRDRVD